MISLRTNSQGKRTAHLEIGNWFALVANTSDTYLIFTWRIDDKLRCFALRSQHAPPVWWSPTILNDDDVNATEFDDVRVLRRVGIGWLLFTLEAIWTP